MSTRNFSMICGSQMRLTLPLWSFEDRNYGQDKGSSKVGVCVRHQGFTFGAHFGKEKNLHLSQSH